VKERRDERRDHQSTRERRREERRIREKDENGVQRRRDRKIWRREE
jgi:hypothetical protein